MKYSVIIAYYQGELEDDTKLFKLISSIPKREDIEILVVHDGPLKHPIKSEGFRLIATLQHDNKWGHPSRDLGIRQSMGKFTLVTNHDNVYAEGTFDYLDSIIEDSIGVYILRVKMMGMIRLATGNFGYTNPRDYSSFRMLDGKPVEVGNVDVMQVMIARAIWDKFGFWKNNAIDSDGVMIRKMSVNYNTKHYDFVIGEHY